MNANLVLTTYVAAPRAEVLSRLAHTAWHAEAPDGTEVQLTPQAGLTELRVVVPWQPGAAERTLVASRLFNRITAAVAA